MQRFLNGNTDGPSTTSVVRALTRWSVSASADAVTQTLGGRIGELYPPRSL